MPVGKMSCSTAFRKNVAFWQRVQSALKQYLISMFWPRFRKRVSVIWIIGQIGGLPCDNVCCAGCWAVMSPIDLANSTGLHLRGSGWPVLDFGAEFLALTDSSANVSF